jgi:ComF family protein
MPGQDGVSSEGWKPGPRARAQGQAAQDLVFPPAALDGGPAPQTGGFSAEAWSRIAFLDNPLCDGCGAPFPHDQGEARCPACLQRPRAFDRARAACLYDDASRHAVLQFKHADRTELAPLFARWISRAARELIAEAEIVMPVPMRPFRLFRRRYNQAAEIARPLARLTGLAYLPDSLRRIRDTDTQGGKSGVARRRNVAAAFAVPEGQVGRVRGRRVLLIDDVLTTGATAEACARALKLAGAAAVYVAVVARVKEAANLTI